MKYYTGVTDRQIYETIYMSSERTQSESYFVNEDKDIVRQIIDPWGNLRNFPGIKGDKQYTPIVHELVEFKRISLGFLVIWTIENDYFDPGDEWGFGREEYEGVKLYSIIDEYGDYLSAFTSLDDLRTQFDIA